MVPLSSLDVTPCGVTIDGLFGLMETTTAGSVETAAVDAGLIVAAAPLALSFSATELRILSAPGNAVSVAVTTVVPPPTKAVATTTQAMCRPWISSATARAYR